MLLMLPQPVLQVVDTVTSVTSIDVTATKNHAKCPTVRRLAMLRVVCAGAKCPTTRAMVRRLWAAWWGAERRP